MSQPEQQRQTEYWRKNIRTVSILLVLWALPWLFGGIIFVEPLNKIVIGGFPLGFWFAQQGSIYIFIVLVIVYAVLMDRLDRQYEVGEKAKPGEDAK